MKSSYKFPDDFELERLRQCQAFRDLTGYLNSIMCDEEHYIEYYNHFAMACNVQTLDSTNDIYSPKNDQELMIDYILNGHDPFYDRLVYRVTVDMYD